MKKNESAGDVRARLLSLSRIGKSKTPVVSVYLDTRWSDEQQRERVRIFLKNEIAKARDARRAAPADLEWIRTAGAELIGQAAPEARGVALFASAASGLREIVRLRAPIDNSFSVEDTPFLAPLAAAVQRTPSTLVVFVDTESSRLMHVTPEGAGAEVELREEMPGHHSRGDWVEFAYTRYERQIREHRGRHFAAVTESLAQLVEAYGVERIVLAGDPRNVSALRRGMPPALAAHVVGEISASRRDPSGAIVARALEMVGRVAGSRGAPDVDAVLTEAAKSGQAVAGVSETVEAVNRGAVHRLYALRGLRGPAAACVACGTLFSGEAEECRLCGGTVKPVELGEALVHRVLAAGGSVDTIEAHQRLAAVGGIAALLRYPL